ncbi:MAG TPA: rRNA maturation RNase YbeY [Burkholderiales bacterium]
MQRACASRAVPAPARLRAWAGAAARGATEVTLRVVGAREARRLNRDYRKRDAATNVLTFCYGRRPWRGDIVLCHPVIAREARAQGKSLDAHYAHMVVHAMLHLRGHDHRRHDEALRMERLERRTLAQLGVADPYAVESTRPRR